MLVDYVRVYQDSGTSNVISDGIYTIASKASGKVMDVVDVSMASGAKIQQWTNYVANNQRFRVESTGDGYYKLTAVRKRFLMCRIRPQPPAFRLHNGTIMDRMRGDGGSLMLAEGITNLSKVSGLAVDVASASTADGAVVQQWTDNGTDAQKWMFTKIN